MTIFGGYQNRKLFSRIRESISDGNTFVQFNNNLNNLEIGNKVCYWIGPDKKHMYYAGEFTKYADYLECILLVSEYNNTTYSEFDLLTSILRTGETISGKVSEIRLLSENRLIIPAVALCDQLLPSCQIVVNDQVITSTTQLIPYITNESPHRYYIKRKDISCQNQSSLKHGAI